MTEHLQDARRTYTFYMDDAVLDVFATRIGAYGVAVYALLARHAKNKQAFPTYTTMQETLGMSRQTLDLTLGRLMQEGLLTLDTRTPDDPDTTRYRLRDLREGAP